MTTTEQLRESLGDRYRVERELGRGGMATVYLAHDLRHERQVAIKVLREDLSASLGKERFLREIKIAAALQHPHILPLYDSGDAGGLLFYVMPFVEGPSVRQKLLREGELPVADAVRILRDVADALAEAHRKGVVHRDLKPENVMLSGRHALVTDFGVAKAVSEATGRQTLTTMGVALGTPTYMAPEQAVADPHVDHRADLYAFGVLAYELLSGRPPFTGSSPQQVLAAHVTAAAEPVTQHRATLPPALATLVMRCLEKKPADRWQSAEEMIPTLEGVLTPSGGSTPTQTQPLAAVARPGARRWGLLTAGAAIVVVGGVLVMQNARPEALDPKVVSVQPFENRTGDPALAALGQNLAERVTRGLGETGVVSLANASGGSTADASDPGKSGERAGTVVGGAIYGRGDSLEFSATITDARAGVVLRTVGPMRGAANRPDAAIDELVQRVMGGVAMMFDETYGNQGAITGQPTTYAAYREYRRGEDYFYAFQWDSAAARFQAAIREDSNFMFARLRIANAYGNKATFAAQDSALNTIELRRNRLTPFEDAFAGFMRAGISGNLPAQYAAGERMARSAPGSAFAAYYHAIGARTNGRWQEALDILNRLDPQGPMLRGRVYYYDYVTAGYHILGDHDAEREAARRGLAQYPDRMIVRQAELRALAAQGRQDEVTSRLTATLSLPSDEQVRHEQIFLLVAEELRVHGHAAASDGVLKSLLGWLDSRPSEERRSARIRWARAQALERTGQLSEAAAIADSLSREDPTNPDYLGERGVVAARLGKPEMARLMDRTLADMRSPFRQGAHVAWRAGIATVLGETEQAKQLLAEAVAAGYNGANLSDADPRLQGLQAKLARK